MKNKCLRLIGVYKEIENRLHKHIESVFGVSFDDPRIKEADDAALLIEAKHLYDREDLSTWGIDVMENKHHIVLPARGSSPSIVKERFLWEYLRLLQDEE